MNLDLKKEYSDFIQNTGKSHISFAAYKKRYESLKLTQDIGFPMAFKWNCETDDVTEYTLMETLNMSFSETT